MSEHMHGVYASESVTEGHPDKLADVVADSILDTIFHKSLAERQRQIDEEGLTIDYPDWRSTGPEAARVAIEGLFTGSSEGEHAGGTVILGGEVTLPEGVTVDYEGTVRNAIAEIGYTDPSAGFSDRFPHFHNLIKPQSPEIAQSVGDGEGAGDQGIIIGYATDERASLMPASLELAHMLTARLTEVRKTGQLPWLKPDGKSQVGLRYENSIPVSIDHLTLATAHDARIGIRSVRAELYRHVVLPTLSTFGICLETDEQAVREGIGRLLINGKGAWSEQWGPTADVGVVGRKLDVDTYGGIAPHGGGALSGKDPTKVDRSGKYAARYLARELVKEHGGKITVRLAYTIGQPYPDSLQIDSSNPNIPQDVLQARAQDILDLSVRGTIRDLGLNNTRYTQTARNGHFGHAEFPWER